MFSNFFRPILSWIKLTHNQVILFYGSMSFFLTLIHNVFLLYYLDMFVSVYKISKSSFYFGEIVFLIWNSINDPFFGWLSDRHLLEDSNGNEECKKFDIIRKRLGILQKSGPLLAVSFILFWFSWLPVSFQFVLCLCLYDGFLTSVDLQHTSLLADFSVHISERAELNKCSSILSACASISVFFSYVFWDKNTLIPFQSFCCIIAFISATGFTFSSSQLLHHYTKLAKNEGDIFIYQRNKNDETSCFSLSTLKNYILQLKNNSNFNWFVCINFLQVFHCHFNSNFFPLFMETLISKDIIHSIGPFVVGFSFVLPHVNNVYFLGLCEKHGVYLVIKGLFIVKLILAFTMMIIGSNNIWLLCLFIASNRVFTEGTCKLLNLVISDLVDEDYVKFQRHNPASALLFGMSSLLAKPGQTIAPLLGTWLLNQLTGEDLFQTKLSASYQDLDFVQKLTYKNGIFHLLTLIPFICAITQLFAWSRFTLHGKRLKLIKDARLKLDNTFRV